MFSLSRSKAGVISRLADYLQYRLNPKRAAVVANQRGVGGVSVSQTSLGIFYPTVQSAIDDLDGRCDLPVDTVIVNTTGIAPGFIPQTDTLQFSGSVEGTVDQDYIIYVLGFPVPVKGGDSNILVASKALAVLQDAQVNSIGIASVELDAGDSTVLNITYNDYQNHVFEPDFHRGITVTQTIIQEPVPGYGSWTRMGTQEVTLTGGSVNGLITLYYFKRDS